MLRKRIPHRHQLDDDGETPNKPRYPLIVYRSAVRLDSKFDPAAVFETLFGKNHWGNCWRATMYAYNHFHTKTHECLAIAKSKLLAQFGGKKGLQMELKAGDVVIIPAGVGHRHIRQSKDLLIVGCYPAGGSQYNEPRPREVDHEKAIADVQKVKRPATDPIYGKRGPLLGAWPS